MPELPEVETTRRGVEPYARGRRVRALHLRETRLRWPVDATLPRRVSGTRITAVERRAKYLLFRLDTDATLMLHLGMSGSLRVLPADTPHRKHDQLRPRTRFGTNVALQRSAPLRFAASDRR
jgi:formamidopyrimidine-DNA glycosylase